MHILLIFYTFHLNGPQLNYLHEYSTQSLLHYHIIYFQNPFLTQFQTFLFFQQNLIYQHLDQITFIMQFSSLPFFPQIRQSIQTLAITNNVDSTHGLAHALKVGSLTLKALEYQEVSAQEHQDIAYAALLHDVDDHKYFKTVDFANAVATLQSLPLPPPRLQKVISIIQLVSFSKNGNQIKPQIPLAFYLPRYIDRSEAIGLEGLYRSYLYNRQKQHPDPIYNADTPRPTCQEDLESMSLGRDKAYMERGGRSATVVDHFFDKLFHIRLPAQLANPELLRLYRAKHQEMVEFLLRHAKDGYLHYEQELLAEGKLRANEWGTHP